MFFEDDDRKYRLLAPDVDDLLRYFDRRHTLNPTSSTDALLTAASPIFDTLVPLAPLKKNEEAKAIWIRIPRGEITDFASFDEMKDCDAVDTYDEYEQMWRDEYPEEFKWYQLVAVQSFNKDGTLRFYAISLGNETVISASTEDHLFSDSDGYYAEGAACRLCSLIMPALQESMEMLRSGQYNDLVEKELPYQFRTGVIKRSVLWDANPESRKYAYDGLSEKTVLKFRDLISSGINSKDRIDRIKSFTANDFFRACRTGYQAIGKDCEGYTLSELYMRYSDGRDEGLTGKGHGLNEGPGIDFDSPAAWDEWYFNRTQHGGHPWEVVPGGNSTHMELYVMNDRRDLEWDLRSKKITKDEYDEKLKSAGYYFVIAGMQRQFESVSFYVSLSEAGMPVIIDGAEEMIARLDGSDYIGIVPHHMYTRYCESLFPAKYGDIVDFTHVYKNEDAWFDRIEWLPVEKAELNL